MISRDFLFKTIGDKTPLTDQKTSKFKAILKILPALQKLCRLEMEICPELEIKDEETIINMKDTNGDTLLILAARNHHRSVVVDLLEAKADPNIRGKDGKTALMCAAGNDDTTAVNVLMKAGAKVDIQCDNGDTALIFAVWNGALVITDILLEAMTKADLNIQGYQYFTALIVAAKSGYVYIADRLIKAGVALDLRDSGGDTALAWAAYSGHAEIVELLLRAGADPKITNRNGRDALAEVMESTSNKPVLLARFFLIAKLLLERGATIQRPQILLNLLKDSDRYPNDPNALSCAVYLGEYFSSKDPELCADVKSRFTPNAHQRYRMFADTLPRFSFDLIELVYQYDLGFFPPPPRPKSLPEPRETQQTEAENKRTF